MKSSSHMKIPLLSKEQAEEMLKALEKQNAGK